MGLLVTIIILVVAFMVFAIWRTVVVHRRRPTTGREELVGKTVVVKKTLEPEGTVFLEDELWDAVTESGPVKSGEKVTITRVDGLKLYVTKKEREVSQ